MSEYLDIIIDRLVYGGEGIGRSTDGKAIFVPYVLPGEVVRVRLVEDKPHHAHAELMEVLEASPDRITPRCKHFGLCGGCHYQHMDYPNQVNAKAAILKEQLERIGGFTNLPVIKIQAAPEAWNYRNTVQFHLTPEGKLGFQKAGTNESFAIQECHLPEEAINLLWPQVEIEPTAGVERINMRAGVEGDLMIVLETPGQKPLEFDIEGVPVSVVQDGPSGCVVLAGSDHIQFEIAGKQFVVSARSFFQVNRTSASQMVRSLLNHLPAKKEITALDIYCGVGLFSAFLAPRVTRLVGIEISPEACEDFTTNLDAYDHVELYEAPAEEVLSNVKFNPDLIVMDPPRAGLGGKTIEGIITQAAPELVYISCDPATMARDGRRLAANGYRLAGITLIDMFPQTFHIESISFWEQNK